LKKMGGNFDEVGGKIIREKENYAFKLGILEE
jgi:hypothetical protein